MGVVTGPRVEVELAAEILNMTEREVIDLMHRGRIVESWLVEDGKRRLTVRTDDLVRLLSRAAPPTEVQAR